MNHGTKITGLPDLTANLLRDGGCLIDNLFADLWKHVGMKARMNRIGFHKRSGTPTHELVYCLMIWVWLKVDSIGMFARESLQTFSQARTDALYAPLNQEDWNWRRLHLEVAQQAVRGATTLNEAGAFVLDDSIQVRHGKRMPGVSSHFDHTSGRHVMGQQVLTLGLSRAEGFVPIDSELFISATKAQGLHQPFCDGRSVTAKRYRVAQSQTKPQMAKDMIRRAQRAGIEADYLLADAWFGTKPMIRLAGEKAEVTALGDNPRFVVTSMEMPEPKTVYTELYCARGRTSCTTFLANCMRLQLHPAACVLHQQLRTQALKYTELSTAQPGSVILKLFKIAVQVKQYEDRVILHLPSACTVKHLLSPCHGKAVSEQTPSIPIRLANRERATHLPF